MNINSIEVDNLKEAIKSEVFVELYDSIESKVESELRPKLELKIKKDNDAQIEDEVFSRLTKFHLESNKEERIKL